MELVRSIYATAKSLISGDETLHYTALFQCDVVFFSRQWLISAFFVMETQVTAEEKRRSENSGARN